MSTTSEMVISLLTQLEFADVPDEVTSQLQALNKVEVVDTLVGLLDSEDADLQERAFYSILRVDRERGVELVLKLLSNPDWEWSVCYSMIGYGDARITHPLVNMLKTSKDNNARYMAIIALARHGDSTALSDLEQIQANDKSTDFEGRRLSEAAKEAIQAIVKRAT